MFKLKKLKGFTLIELMIVVVIIAILAGLGIQWMNPAQLRRRANESVMKANTAKVCLALGSCISGSNASFTECDTFAEMGVTAAPAGAAVSIVGTNIRVVSTLGTCRYACNFDTATGVGGAIYIPTDAAGTAGGAAGTGTCYNL